MVRKMMIHMTLSPLTATLAYQWAPPGKKAAGHPSAQCFSILPTDCSHAFWERVTLK